MPKFTVEHSSNKAVDETYSLIKTVLDKESDIKKYDANAKCTFNDAKKSCSIAGSQFKAEMSVSEKGSGSQVVIVVDLPFLLTPFKGKVQESLKKMLSRHLT